MNSENKHHIPYHKILIDNGWHKEDNQIYPPYGSFWISGNEDIPLFMVERMHDTIKNQLRKMLESPDREKFQRHIDDLTSYVKITEEIIVGNSIKTK